MLFRVIIYPCLLLLRAPSSALGVMMVLPTNS
jgi:hypothetical protein